MRGLSRSVSLLAVAGTCLLLLADATALAQPKSSTLDFVATVQSSNIVQGTTPSETFKDRLLDAQGKQVDSDTRSCTGLTSDPSGQVCATTLKLKDGTIVADLAFHSSKGGEGEIKSGTGKFVKAVGSVTYRDVPVGTVINERFAVTIKLR